MRLADDAEAKERMEAGVKPSGNLPEGPATAAEVLAALHSGERRAAAWLRRVLAEHGERWS